VLLDGLDEVPDAHNRRMQIKQAVQDFAATFSRCRFLVTGRTYAYQRQDWKLDGFAEAHLLPFTPGQIRGFVAAWYAHMVELYRLSKPDAADRAEVLNRTVERNERIRELAERPLLLTLIAQLQTEGGGALPEKREELYDKAVEMLLTKWETMKVRVREDGTKEIEPSLAEWLNAGRDDIRKQLNRLAFEAHRDQPQLTGTADIRQETLIAALLNASARRDDLNVGLLEKYLRDRAGILAAYGVGMYQFPHRSFQEYLAACHLTDDEFPDKLAELARDEPGRWREVALLAGAKAARGSSLSTWALAETLCPLPPPDGPAPAVDHWGGLLAGRVLVECADLAKVAPRHAEKSSRVRDWQLAILRGDTLPATERALAGRSLAVLGDPRPEAMTLDRMHFCLVPPGPFVMGDDAGSSDEKPRHTVELAYPYFIGRFPVTLAQWREYARISGRPMDDGPSLRGRQNDPVPYVSWRDALRFCDCLTQAWRGLLPQGFVVTLPSETEWEKAARGGERVPVDHVSVTPQQLTEKLEAMPGRAQLPNPFPTRAYPWGEPFDADKANVESAIGETNAVGCYLAGASPYGCEEMSGNLWEWTRSLWGRDLWTPDFEYPYSPDDPKREDVNAGEDIFRVVRGGSWYGHRGYARCAVRRWRLPDYRSFDQGFRVVLRCAPVR
jgi:formylglycine-generating enzyme required for sulfatase activity